VNEPAVAQNRWGFWATAAWAVVALLVGQCAALAFVFWWSGRLYAVLDTTFDGTLTTLFILISNLISMAILWLAARLAKANPINYFSLRLPTKYYVNIGLAFLVSLITLIDVLLYLSGRSLVTPFQLQLFTSAQAQHRLPAMLFASIIIAPAGEEMMFRGFLFRGFVRSERTVWPAIVLISVLWALLHIQYDWAGILQILAIGLFLGWIRWRSGSLLLTFFLHALFNLEGTSETALALNFFS
jgi:uncharacterized protein